jgi:DNA-binding FadR family transcriptional regulator
MVDTWDTPDPLELAERRYRDQLNREDGTPKQKLAAMVAREIERDIVRRGWPVGEVVGSEAELLTRYRVSRPVLREAIRLLEHHMVATMRRGPGGGLIVTEPNPSAITDAVALYLQFRRVEPQYVFDTRVALELAAVQMAAERIDEDGVRRLRAILDRDANKSADEMHVHSHDWHVAIAELSGNPALALFVTTLTRLTRERTERTEFPGEEATAVHYAHGKITEAIIAGDAALARHRMVRHLRAVAEFMR